MTDLIIVALFGVGLTNLAVWIHRVAYDRKHRRVKRPFVETEPEKCREHTYGHLSIETAPRMEFMGGKGLCADVLYKARCLNCKRELRLLGIGEI